jgi:hypothetical protein
MSPPVVPFTSQLTVVPKALCTVAVNFTVVPVKGCAEVGDTATVTAGDGPEEEATPPHEIRNILSDKTSNRNEGPKRREDLDRAYRVRWIIAALASDD